MREKMRRLVAVIMSFMMVWCSMPVSAFAEIVKEASGGISLMSLLKPDEGTYATYRFYVDGAELTAFKQIVKTGDELIEPEAPQQEGYKFTGWKIRGTDKAPKFNIALTAEDIGTGGDVNVDAQFVQVFYVFFHDQFGKIFQTKENEPGKTVSTTDVDLPVGPTQTVTGWRIDDKENGTLAGAQFTVPEKNTDLYPVIEEGHWLTFVTPEDSEYIPPKFYKVGETTAEPTTDPKRAGYKFEGWVVEDTSETFAFGRELEDDVRLEASWTPETVEYTVNYWKEKTDCVGDNIEWGYVSSVKQSGQTGTTTSVSEAMPNIDWGDNEVKEGFKFHHADSATIKGDGTTVVNVYFNRKTFNLNFYDYAGNSFAEMVSATKLIRVKTIEAKYNAYILDQWPLNPKDQSTAWQLWRENEVYTYTSSMVRMPTVPYAAKEGKMHDGNFYARPTRAYNVEFRYYLENLNGGYAEPSTEAGTLRIGTYSDTTTEKTSVTDEEILKFQGFEHDTTQGTQVGEGLHNGGANGKGDNDKWGTPKKFYYKRLSFDIVFDFQAEDVADVTKSFKYEAPINSAEFEPDASQTKKAPNGDPYTFDGWYTDPDCTQKMDFNAKMPAYNLRVYAKWYLTEVNATAHQKEYEESPDGEYHDGDSYFPSIPYGHSISEKYEDYMSRLPSKKAILKANGYEGNPDDYTIYGWVDGNDNPFNFDQKLFGHVDIYPVIGLVGPFYLEYNANGGQGNAPTDERKYRGGSAADVQNGSNLTPPEGKDDYVFLGWSLNPEAETGDYQPGGKFSFDKATVGEAEPGKTFTLYAIWGPKPGKTTVTYHSNYQGKNGLTDKPDEVRNNLDINGQITVEADTLFPAPDDYEFVEWNTKANGKGTSFGPNASARVDTDGDNDLYAIWKRKTGSLTIIKIIETDDVDNTPAATFVFSTVSDGNKPEMREDSEICRVEFQGKSKDQIYEETFDNIPTGTYKVKETFEGNDYVAANPEQEVTIESGKTAVVTFTNTYRGAKLTVEKTVTSTPKNGEAYVLGEEVTYTIKVTNIGKVTLTGVRVEDDKADRDSIKVSEEPGLGWPGEEGMLRPDQSVTFTAKHTITQQDILEGTKNQNNPFTFTNIATAYGTDSEHPDTPPVTDTDTETVPVVEPEADLQLEKTAAIEHKVVSEYCKDENDPEAHAGDIINYTITVTYTGTVNLSDVTVSDELEGLTIVDGDDYTHDGHTATIEEMNAPGSTVVIKATYTVTAGDVEAGKVHNVATAKADNPTDPGKPFEPRDDEDVPVERNPNLDVLKKAYDDTKNPPKEKDSEWTLDEVVTYHITVTNSGNVTLNNVIVEDGLEGATIVAYENQSYDIVDGKAVIDEMTPGAGVTVYATYKISQADVDIGSVDNTATANGTADNPEDPNNPVEVGGSSNEHITTVKPNPQITVDKTADPKEGLKVGDVVTYTIVVTNSGTVTLTDVTLTDILPGLTFVADENHSYNIVDGKADIGTMAPDESVTVYATYKITETDVINGKVYNKATATGKYNGEGTFLYEGETERKPIEGSDEETVSTVTANPSMTITKTVINSPANGTAFEEGEEVRYVVTVTNDGNLTLMEVHVVDELTGDEWTIGTLEPGESRSFYPSYVVRHVDTVSGSVTNVVTATAENPDPNKPDLEVSAEVTVPTEYAGSLMVTKRVTSTPAKGEAYAEGESVTYSVTVTNTGSVDLVNVVVTDRLTGNQWTIPTLAAGESQTFETNPYRVTKADTLNGIVPNVVTATGTDPNGNTVESSFEVDVPTVLSATMTITKRATNRHADGSPYKLGETIEYEIVVTNTSRGDITNVTVTDELTGDQWTIPTLAAGESQTFPASHVVTREDTLAGHVLNVATATGTGPDDKPVDPDPAEDDEPTEFTAAMTITKRATNRHANNAPYKLGETIEYEIVVTNTSKVDITNVIVTDELTGDQWTIPTLAAGETQTFHASHVVTEADTLVGHVLNVATATGTDPNGDPVEPDPAEDDEPTVPSAHLTVTKVTTNEPANGEAYALGETITYNVMVTNDSLVTANNVAVTDPLTGDEWIVGTLEPGESSPLYSASYVVTEADTVAGHVLNVATATGKDPDDNDIPTDPGEDDEPTVPSAHLTLTKVATSTPANGRAYAVGETITYNVTVTNDSQLTVTDVVVTDELTGAQWVVGTMEPGATQTFETSYVVTEEDTLAGHVLNVATATGTDPDGNPVDPDPAEDDEPTIPTAHMTITKTATSTPANGSAYGLGETITYDVTATNDGLADLTNAVVTDELTGDQWTVPTLAVGESVTFQTSYVVTEADVLAGHVLNVATGTATGPDPEDPDVPVDPGEDDEPTVPVAHLTIIKTATSTPANGEAYGLGETITYDVTVVNDSVADVTDVVVTDEVTGDQWTIPFLASGDSATFTTSYVVTAADVVAGHVLNVATGTATGPDPENPEVPVEPDDDDEPTVSQAHLSIFKTATSTPANGIAYVAGEIVTYSITALNDGIIELLDVVVTDDLTGSSWTIPSMQPGDSQTFTTTYVVTDADAQAGYVLNVATATATSPDPNNPPTITPDEEIVPAAPTYTLTIQYLYLDGTVAAETYFQDGLVAGMTYDVTSPVIPGFTATQAVVAGAMPAANVLVTVFYAPTPAPGPGGPGLVTLDEYGVPLNIGNLVMNVGDCFE